LSAGSRPQAIISGPDGALWFTDAGGNSIGRIDTSGTLTGTFAIPTAQSNPHGIAVGPDGNLWLVETDGNKIARVTVTALGRA